MNNKLLNYMNKNMQTLAVAGLVAAAAAVSQAQSYTAAGDFNGWNTAANPMSGGPVTYSCVIAPGTGTAGTPYEFKVTDGTWANYWPGSNARLQYDSNGGNTIYFTPGTIIDGWNPIMNRVGYADPGNLAIELTGTFNGVNWGSNPAYQLNSVGNGVYSNSIVITTAGTYECKFRASGTWSSITVGADFGVGSANCTFTTTNSPQTMKFQLDLPNGRWLIGDLPPPPVTNTVVFSVDMTPQVTSGHFDPNSNTVECRGSFNGYTGGAFVLTNNPTGVNTNLYVGVTNIVGNPLAAYYYKFYDSNARAGNNGYESPVSTGGGDRTFNLLAANGTLTLPTVYYSDLSWPADFITEDTLVTFTVSMTNAVTTGNVAFNPTTDNVYLNGDWIPWWAWADPLAPWTPYVLTNGTSGDQLYSGTFLVPKGTTLKLSYLFSINGGNNELPAYVNHIRYVRKLGNYTMPLDTFGTRVTEPQLGTVTIGAPSGGNVPVSWVGLPSANLQTATSILGPWMDHPETSAYGSPSGIYATNYPMSGQAIYFRAVKP
jgi:hypothetical protein